MVDWEMRLKRERDDDNREGAVTGRKNRSRFSERFREYLFRWLCLQVVGAGVKHWGAVVSSYPEQRMHDCPCVSACEFGHLWGGEKPSEGWRIEISVKGVFAHGACLHRCAAPLPSRFTSLAHFVRIVFQLVSLVYRSSLGIQIQRIPKL